MEETTLAKPVQKRRGRKKGISIPTRVPIPVRSLWESASQEEKQKAHKTAATLLQYWIGHKSKKEVAEELKIPQLRIWQLSGQAAAGMAAGLLKQPRARKGALASM